MTTTTISQDGLETLPVTVSWTSTRGSRESPCRYRQSLRSSSRARRTSERVRHSRGGSPLVPPADRNHGEEKLSLRCGWEQARVWNVGAAWWCVRRPPRMTRRLRGMRRPRRNPPVAATRRWSACSWGKTCRACLARTRETSSSGRRRRRRRIPRAGSSPCSAVLRWYRRSSCGARPWWP